MTVDEAVRRLELEALYADYAHCLDGDDLEAWPDFFVDDCAYRITSAENYEAGLPIGIVYATSKDMLRDRVTALREANIYEPQHYRHMISCVKIVGEDAAGIGVVAHFMVVRIMQDGPMSLFGVGRYIDRVRRDGGGWKFVRKEVVLDSRQVDTLLAIPI